MHDLHVRNILSLILRISLLAVLINMVNVAGVMNVFGNEYILNLRWIIDNTNDTFTNLLT